MLVAERKPAGRPHSTATAKQPVSDVQPGPVVPFIATLRPRAGWEAKSGSTNRNVAFGFANVAVSVENASFLSHVASFLLDRASLPTGPSDVPTGQASWILRRLSFPRGKAPFVIGKAAGVLGKASFTRCDASRLVGRVSVLLVTRLCQYKWCRSLFAEPRRRWLRVGDE